VSTAPFGADTLRSDDEVLVRRFVKWLFLPLLFLGIPLHAQADNPRLLILQGVCVGSDTALRVQGRLAVAASSLQRVGCPLIVVNPKLLYQFPASVQTYILLHEYSHIELGHVPQTDSSLAAGQDWAADCNAARIMQRMWPALLPEVVAFLGEKPARPDVRDATRHATFVADCARIP